MAAAAASPRRRPAAASHPFAAAVSPPPPASARCPAFSRPPPPPPPDPDSIAAAAASPRRPRAVAFNLARRRWLLPAQIHSPRPLRLPMPPAGTSDPPTMGLQETGSVGPVSWAGQRPEPWPSGLRPGPHAFTPSSAGPRSPRFVYPSQLAAQQHKAEKLIREMESKCNEKISENKQDSERYLVHLKEEHGTMVARIQQDNEHKESTLQAYHKEELQCIKSQAEKELREKRARSSNKITEYAARGRLSETSR